MADIGETVCGVRTLYSVCVIIVTSTGSKSRVCVYQNTHGDAGTIPKRAASDCWWMIGRQQNRVLLKSVSVPART